MKISEKFKLSANQYQLDFVDVDIEHDSKLYIDPFLISKNEDNWSVKANRTIKNFFNKFCNHILDGEYDKAIQVYQYAHEPKDTCLGMSETGTVNGKGLGEENAKAIVDELVKTKAIERGSVKCIEDIRLFVDGIDKDKLSDAVSDIIRKHLIDYTKTQCKMWGIPTQLVQSYPYWNPSTQAWDSTMEESIVIGEQTIVLVPKAIVSTLYRYSAQHYNNLGIVDHERNIHLARRSELVTFEKDRKGNEKAKLNKSVVKEELKKDFENGSYYSYKDFIRRYTEEHPKVYQEYRKRISADVIIMSNEDISKRTGTIQMKEFIQCIVDELSSIETGGTDATKYHHFVKGIIELIFYPSLVNPIIEQDIHQGRKRIDIVMDNSARRGFFYKLHSIKKIFCPYIYFECKNYTSDIKNPELDQLSGRFSTQKGQFGILLCRNIENREYIYQKCADTYSDGRGMIIPLDDSDIINMLQYVLKDDFESIDAYMNKLLRNIIMKA